MKTLITYFSLTGNTEKVARSISDAVKTEKDIIPIQDVKNIEKYDLIFCGFPVVSHSLPPVAARFIKGLPPGKKLAIFSTHGSLRGGQLAVTAMEQAVSLALNSKVLGTFSCRGKVQQKVIDDMVSQAENRAWAQEAMGADPHPDKADLEDAREFAKKIMATSSSS
ncbi:MAG TPA: hypothetical protein ENG95_04760 [Nitrospirae bacterium]|nr:flavodoxin [bacterium BMS3Abin10]GBE39340.1 flavodoxin [bacterium BMS3Bbin08]HDH51337.1 hypothetical protein [Nitrospirota bacterium]HDK81388.1 hypothetical protein [Nitrospirota bacterium]HDO25932.1 hypothetical protein [Nitrospirota bacterium]